MSLVHNPGSKELNLLFENQRLKEEISRLKIRLGQQAVEIMQKSAQISATEERVLRTEARAMDLEGRLLIKGIVFEDKERMLIHAREETRRLLTLIKIHKMQTGHDLCWMNDLALWREALYDQTIEYPHDTVPPEEEFELGCEAWCRPYYRSRSKCQDQLLVGKPPVMPGYDK